MLSSDISSFCQQLREDGGTLGLFLRGDDLVASHSNWQAFADEIADHEDFRKHRAAFFQVGSQSGYLHSVFLHRTRRGPGAGGVRRRSYGQVEGLVQDGLRLAIGMGYKNALAGLWWGGGKGVIGIDDPDFSRETVYREFGQFLSRLNGCYVTAEDVGTKPGDMATIFTQTRFTTCIPASHGGSGNPSPATARGVFVGIEAAFRHLGLEDWSERTVAIQGLGEVGLRLAHQLHQAGATLVVFDPETSKMEEVLQLDCRHRASTDEGILTEPVDLVSPCALGAVLNPRTIPLLKCRAICGAANNQLAKVDRDAAAIHSRGILFVPDFVVNRMGIVNCADEQHGRLDPDPAIERHLGWEWEHSIGNVVLRLLQQSHHSGQAPVVEASRRAEEMMELDHPIWPGRARQIAEHSWQQIRAQARR